MARRGQKSRRRQRRLREEEERRLLEEERRLQEEEEERRREEEERRLQEQAQVADESSHEQSSSDEERDRRQRRLQEADRLVQEGEGLLQERERLRQEQAQVADESSHEQSSSDEERENEARAVVPVQRYEPLRRRRQESPENEEVVERVLARMYPISAQRPSQDSPEPQMVTPAQSTSISRESRWSNLRESEGDFDDTMAFIFNWGGNYIICSCFIWIMACIFFSINYRDPTDKLRLIIFTVFTCGFCMIVSAGIAVWANFSFYLSFVFGWLLSANFFLIGFLNVIIISRSLMNNPSELGFDEIFFHVTLYAISIWLSFTTIVVIMSQYSKKRTGKANPVSFVKTVRRVSEWFYSVLLLIAASLHVYDACVEPIYVPEIVGQLFWSMCGVAIIASVSFFATLFVGLMETDKYSAGGITFRQFQRL